MVLRDADIDGVSLEGELVIGGDAFIRSDNDWFTDLDDVAPHQWVVYRTKRPGQWQACAGCVHEIDLHPDMDFSDTSIYIDDPDGIYVAAREAQRDRVLAEIARREAL